MDQSRGLGLPTPRWAASELRIHPARLRVDETLRPRGDVMTYFEAVIGLSELRYGRSFASRTR